jgi:ERCC4-type nuclease
MDYNEVIILADLSVVVIDSREKNDAIFKYLEKNKVAVTVDMLDVGDIMVLGEENFLIERKTEMDFIGSLTSGRLFNQMRNLAENADIKGFVPVMMFIGRKWKMWKFRKVKPMQIAGALNTIRFKYGIHIIEEETEAAAAVSLLNLIKMFDPQKKVKKVYPIRTISKKNLTDEEYVRGILEGFPTIGPTMAKRWQEKFVTLDECLKAIDSGELQKIHGFGPKTIDAIKKIYP